MKITFEKDGSKKTVEDHKENIKCMELAGWVVSMDKTTEKHDNPAQSKDVIEGNSALPSGAEKQTKKFGRPKGV